MRVALVANSFPILSETFIYNHAAGLRARGIDVTVVATNPVNDAAMFADFDGTLYDGPVRDVVLSRGYIRTARQAAARLRTASARDHSLWKAARGAYGTSQRALRAWLIALPLADFDVVHIEYSGVAAAYLDALRLLAPSRVVVSCRGTQERIVPLVEPARALLLCDVFAVVARVHCVSSDMLRTCVSYGLDPAKAFVNRPAVDANRFTRTTPYSARQRRPFKLVSTGRLHWAKGLEFALLAVRALVDGGREVHLEIIGGGPEHERLEFAIHDLRLTSNVRLSGRRSPTQVRAALEGADVFVLSSVSEGVSNAALEAMSMGVPIVTTDAGGMNEAVTDGVEGRVVPSRAPEALAEAIASLFDAPAVRVEMGLAGRRRIENEFTIERQITTFVAEYEALMRPPRA